MNVLRPLTLATHARLAHPDQERLVGVQSFVVADFVHEPIARSGLACGQRRVTRPHHGRTVWIAALACRASAVGTAHTACPCGPAVPSSHRGPAIGTVAAGVRADAGAAAERTVAGRRCLLGGRVAGHLQKCRSVSVSLQSGRQHQFHLHIIGGLPPGDARQCDGTWQH